MTRTLPRIAIVLLTLAAWTFASNHCAIAAIVFAAPQAGAHSCCHQDDVPQKPAVMMECCQALNAPIPAVTAAPVTHLFELFPAWSELAMPTVIPVEVPRISRISASGPPGAEAFAEQVLNRRLLAHAPPYIVA